MKASRQLARLVFLALPLILGSGCATKALWTNGNLEASNEPADKANLRLFTDTSRSDLLVVYDEYSERSGITHTRAYWLNQNEKRLEKNGAPYFVGTNSIRHLRAVPMFDALPESTNSSAELWALFTTTEQSFTLYFGHREISSHRLPHYNDRKGKVEKAALTPLAVTADLTIVGGIIGYAYLEGMASGYNSSY
jgi:hypothetical protein